jgi:hypothetical protein
MDIDSFYQQAKIWKMNKEEQDRAQELEQLKQLAAIWDKATEAIREVLPIQGAKLWETEMGQTADFPYNNGCYQFDLVLPGAIKDHAPANDEGRDMRGVIRVVVKCIIPNSFGAIGYYVWVDGSMTHFESPYEAFLACCTAMNYVPIVC